MKTEAPQAEGGNRETPAAIRSGRPAGHRLLWLLLLLPFVAAGCLFGAHRLMYRGIVQDYTLELGEELPPAGAFLLDSSVGAEYITDVATVEISQPGACELEILTDRGKRRVTLTIRDTVAPSAEPVETWISVTETLTPDAAVTSLTDAGRVRLSWDKKPEFGTVGDYEAAVLMSDAAGNSAVVSSTVHVRAVADGVLYEAGGPLPGVGEFLFRPEDGGKFAEPLESLPLDVPGVYEVAVELDGTVYTCPLTVTDTVPPELTVRALFIQPGETAQPEELVVSCTDATALSFAFAEQPDFSQMNIQYVTVVATDAAGNSAQAEAALVITHLEPATVELRGAGALKPSECVANIGAYGYVYFPDGPFVPDTPGVYAIPVMLGGERNITLITVADTTPPEGEAVSLSGFTDHPIAAADFTRNVTDLTDVTVSFAAEPDWTVDGTQTVELELTDSSGNVTPLRAELTLEYDVEPPELNGVQERYCYVGDAVAYYAEVYASDNCTPADTITLTVDNSLVDINTRGSYEVTYAAADEAGNTTERTVVFTFVEKTVRDEDLEALADEILDEIITDDISIGYQLKAVFDYIRKHITFSGTSDKTDWKAEAYRGLTEHVGDCFTYYAATHLLLEKLDVEIISVERLSTISHHYWHLVNDGSGWYHFDACPSRITLNCFMCTDAKLNEYSFTYWRYDQSIYPTVATAPYVLK